MNLATQLQAVVVGWQIYALTHDPLSLGLIGLAEALPFIGFALPAGHLADRTSRLRSSAPRWARSRSVPWRCSSSPFGPAFFIPAACGRFTS